MLHPAQPGSQEFERRRFQNRPGRESQREKEGPLGEVEREKGTDWDALKGLFAFGSISFCTTSSYGVDRCWATERFICVVKTSILGHKSSQGPSDRLVAARASEAVDCVRQSAKVQEARNGGRG